VAKLGYAAGFVIVILGRQQLFTKNTLTIILPLLNRRGGTPARLRDVARLWAIILAANLCGAAAFAGVMTIPGLFSSETRDAFNAIGTEAVSGSFILILVRSILAGWLIALMIWLLPFAESARLWVISGLAYVVGIGHLPHVVAGSVSALFAVFSGDLSFGRYLIGFLAPALIGNAIGGVALVAVGAHAEFVEEGDGKKKS
jgi:formate/nitrite transporter FocA (FNT family)